MREVERELRDLKKETDSEASRRLSTAASAMRRQSFWIAVRPLKMAQNDTDLQAFGDGLLEDQSAEHEHGGVHGAAAQSRFQPGLKKLLESHPDGAE